MTCRKGQASIESLVAITFALFILVMFSLLASQKNNEGNSLKLRTDAKRVCTSIADNINTIAEEGSGFYKYFAIPSALYGENEYEINVYGNLIEISAGDYRHIKGLITSNVNIACLDKGLSKRNKVYSDQENITIICYRPELVILNNSFRVNNTLPPIKMNANGTMNVSIIVLNFGSVDAGKFNVSFNVTTAAYNYSGSSRIAPLRSEEKAEASVIMNGIPATGRYPVEIRADPEDAIYESIETNNFYNGTINVI